jgi:purine nucleoside phosphorylase
MTRWASSVPVSDEEDEERESVEPEWGECSNCHHRGAIGTLCALCEDAGFVHESASQRQSWQLHLSQERAIARTWRQRVELGVRRLVRVGRAGNMLPEVGQGCFVVRGKEANDMGQEAVITKRTASRVHIAYRDKNGRQATRLKHPGSLVLLEDGLHVSQDADGFVWIRRERG